MNSVITSTVTSSELLKYISLIFQVFLDMMRGCMAVRHQSLGRDWCLCSQTEDEKIMKFFFLIEAPFFYCDDEGSRPSETLLKLPLYQTARRHIPEDRDTIRHCRKKFKVTE